MYYLHLKIYTVGFTWTVVASNWTRSRAFLAKLWVQYVCLTASTYALLLDFPQPYYLSLPSILCTHVSFIHWQVNAPCLNSVEFYFAGIVEVSMDRPAAKNGMGRTCWEDCSLALKLSIGILLQIFWWSAVQFLKFSVQVLIRR